MSCPTTRIHPLRKPPNHQPPIPRWKLSLPNDADQVFISYIGIEQHDASDAARQARQQITRSIQDWAAASSAVSEIFGTIPNSDSHHAQEDSPTIWVCYWLNVTDHTHARSTLNLCTLHSSLTTPTRPSIGLWHETFRTTPKRLETNYSGLDYLPGLAKLPNTTTVSHSLSTYWGAARDRIPDSAHHLFPRPASASASASAESTGRVAVRQPFPVPRGLGQYLTGSNRDIDNMVHIRSGQYWKNCSHAEADAYEKKLEPSLRAGMQFLDQNKAGTGTLCMRYLQNVDVDLDGEGELVDKKESCGVGFLANLENLENWAKGHASHLKIWRGAMAHYKAFGDERRFRTWHEVCVVREGDARFEYVNCRPGTGVINSVPLEVEDL